MPTNIKLSYTKARHIREAYAKMRAGGREHAECTAILAMQYDVHRRSIDRVVYGDAWNFMSTVAGQAMAGK